MHVRANAEKIGSRGPEEHTCSYNVHAHVRTHVYIHVYVQVGTHVKTCLYTPCRRSAKPQQLHRAPSETTNQTAHYPSMQHAIAATGFALACVRTAT